MQYVWFYWSLLILLVWIIIYLVKKDSRREMLLVSLWTSPLGLTEPFFVPSYWNPPSLFDLAQNTGFDIESLIFCFAIGGIGSVLYNLILRQQYKIFTSDPKFQHRHKYHKYVLYLPVVVFFGLALITKWNHIYCGVIAMFVGALATLWCRPDLTKKVWIGGILFTLLYFIFFTSLTITYPDYVDLVWNLKNLTGIKIVNVPLEEYLFSFTFGMLWSSIYEHFSWTTVVRR